MAGGVFYPRAPQGGLKGPVPPESVPLPPDTPIILNRDEGFSQGNVRAKKITTEPQRILDANPERKYLLMVNTTITTVYLGFDNNIDTATPQGIPLASSGGSYEPLKTPKGEVWAVAAADTTIQVAEGI